MSTNEHHSLHHASAYHAPEEDVFGANAIRLSPSQCVMAALILALLYLGLPALWTRIEPLNAGPDYRIPYALNEDYWLYARYADEALQDDQVIPIIGDSVIWGQYVKPNETLSCALNSELGYNRYINLGLNGSHPAALAGLVKHFGGAVSARKVVLHYNPLWTTSKRRDLQTDKPSAFNHPSLVPQFYPRISSYDATVATRLGRAIDCRVPFLSWLDHVSKVYFENQGVASWSLENPYANPFAAVTLQLPTPEMTEPSPPVPWSEKDAKRQSFDWVMPEDSLQWASMKESLKTLRSRGNDVFVLLGPFNEHLLTDESRSVYRQIRGELLAWLDSQGVPYAAPEPLPTELYADASHPLKDGYAALAKALVCDAQFVKFSGP